MKTPAKYTVGHRIRARGTSRRQLNKELLEHIEATTRGHAVYGAGAFTRHIVFDIFTPISYCGRFTGDTSTAPMPTLIGVVCRTCQRRWNAAIDRRNELIEAENDQLVEGYRVRFAAFVADDELEEFRDAWKEDVKDNKELFRRLTAALIEQSHIDPQDIFEQVRKRNGEPESFAVRYAKRKLP
jgi:hypothetical protein